MNDIDYIPIVFVLSTFCWLIGRMVVLYIGAVIE